jgi:hypothetical protein
MDGFEAFRTTSVSSGRHPLRLTEQGVIGPTAPRIAPWPTGIDEGHFSAAEATAAAEHDIDPAQNGLCSGYE